VVGDIVPTKTASFVVKEMEGAKITKVGVI